MTAGVGEAGDDAIVTFTEFRGAAASSKVRRQEPLSKLRDRVLTTTAAAKADLPWLKLAEFGEAKTPLVPKADGSGRMTGGSYRHDANVLHVTGLEADYDGCQLPPEDAVEKLTKAGIYALVYISPSHAADAPRWRVVCPFSKTYPPQQRAAFLGRLNGVLGGILAGESWTLSQSYYFGRVGKNPAHMAKIVEGDCIDLMDELDEIWTGKPNTGPAKANGAGGLKSGPVDEVALLQAIQDGTAYHAAMLRLMGRWAMTGKVPMVEAKRRLLDAMEVTLPPDRDQRWLDRRADLDRCIEYVYGKQDAKPKPSPSNAAPDPEVLAGIRAVVDDFNARLMVVNEQGKAVILQPGYDPVLKRRTYDRLTVRDLQTLYMNHHVQVGADEKGNAIWKTAADLWLRHRDRRQYIHGVTFDPTSTTAKAGVLNLWEGFAVTPQPGVWARMRRHIEQVLCGGVQAHSDYFIGWMARMMQRPAEQGETAIVLKGVEGCGKGFVARAIGRIAGQHGIAISNAKHLVGNFNAHLRDSIFLFADEAFFAGDRSHVGVLKSIITEPHLTIEDKYQNAASAANFLHVMMASNEEWVVPASIEARRFFVLNVLSSKVGDHAYFAALNEEMENGGYEAMLHDLLAMDLTGFNVRSVPTTEGLQCQRKLSLGTTEAWWLDCLERGYVFKSKLGLDNLLSTWLPKVSTELLAASYAEYARGRGERRPLSREGLGEFFTRSLKVESVRLRNAIAGEAMQDDANPFGGTTRKAKPVIHPRPPGYDLGDLQEARTAFARYSGLAVLWDGGAKDDDAHPDRPEAANTDDPSGDMAAE